MKIDELNQNTALSHVANGRTDKSEPADVHGETAAKKQAAAVKVELSSYMPVLPASQKQQDPRVSRVEELKSQINSGTYQVSGRAVAEKMLSKIVMSTAH
ncbi:MAG: flagellar biosynthesis anti-sigma factor FlgM [Geobacteraceae bacterium GWC2_58_44]|nr:MAG: flagellar biosynthesis anti-sigma factor FlgM [Geobacteraceae bacterium GWC2_58_44]